MPDPKPIQAVVTALYHNGLTDDPVSILVSRRDPAFPDKELTCQVSLRFGATQSSEDRTFVFDARVLLDAIELVHVAGAEAPPSTMEDVQGAGEASSMPPSAGPGVPPLKPTA